MKKDDVVYLHHVLDAIHRIDTYVQGISKEAFFQKELLQDGVIRQLEIIGEASRNLSDEFREDNPEIPWSQIIGMRNRIVHAYFNVDLEITWGIVTMDLPILKEYLITLLEEKRGK